MTINTIVFDVGKVLFDYNPERIIHQIIPDTPHFEDYKSKLFDAPVWLDLDRGIISEAEAAKKLALLFPEEGHEHALLKLIQDFVFHMTGIGETQQLFKQLKTRYPVYLLSNFQPAAFERLCQAHPFLKEVTGTVVSGYVHLLKPEPAIYRYLLDNYKLKPEETLFIDDRPENIAAAKEHGMNGILYLSPDQLITDFNYYGVKWN